MAYNVLSGAVKALNSASIALTGTFTGDGSDLHFPYSQVPEYVVDPEDNRIITFTTTTGKTLRGEPHLTFDGDTLLILSGATTRISLANDGHISASAFYFGPGGRQQISDTSTDMSILAVSTGMFISADGGSVILQGQIDINQSGILSSSQNISASAFYGDGSNLTGITASTVEVADGPIGSLQFREDLAGEISGSANVLYDFSANRLSVRGGIIYNRTAVSTAYTASIDDHILAITSVPLEILLDATLFSAGQALVVKDETGGASALNQIQLNPSASQTIDGESTANIESPYGALLLYSNGSNWFIY